MARRDAIVAAAVLALAAVATWQSALLPFGGIHAPGPGFFPLWASLLIAGLAIVLLGQAVTARGAGASESTRSAPARPAQRAARGVGKVALLVVALTIYVAALEPLGYPVCTFLLVLFMLRILEPQRWPVALAMAVLTAGASYVLFAIWLGVPLPPGPLAR